MPVVTDPTPRRRRGSGVPEVYDFRQPVTLTREHARAVEVAVQNFARQWSTVLTSRLGAVSTVALDKLELSTYADYIEGLPGSTTAVVLHTEPSRTPALLQIPTHLTMTVVDCLLGGPAVDLEIPFRELTEIESRLLGDLLEYACADLSYGLASVGAFSFTVRGLRYNPGFMQLVPASDQVLVARLEMTVGPVTGPITVMLAAEPLLVALRSSDEQAGRTPEEQQEHDDAVALLAERLTDVPVHVSAQFHSRTMSAASVASLEVGDVVPLRHHADVPLDIVVGGVTLARAAIGANGTRAACLVVSTEEDS